MLSKLFSIIALMGKYYHRAHMGEWANKEVQYQSKHNLQENV